MFTTEAELEERLTTASPGLIADLAKHRGDLIILGAGGKMGPTMAMLARNAFDAAGRTHDAVIAVSRWGDADIVNRLRDNGVVTVTADLMSDDLDELPDAADVMFMVGAKFGSANSPSWAWAVNAALPDRVARRYVSARITAFSTGNVYPFVPVSSGGSREDEQPSPVGEYAMSCFGRERVFEFAAATRGTPISIVRLNYAIDLRYGVLSDIATAIQAGEPVDLTTGHVNVVWQGYANDVALRSMAHASSEVFTINVTGPEILGIDTVARRLADRLGLDVSFTGTPASTALLSDATTCFDMYGYPDVTSGTLIDWQAAWCASGGRTSGRPTKWAVRDGRF